MSESREQIRHRMLHNAAKIWGYPETEEASGFDPLVNLLLSVNATELERLSNEIHHSRNRVMERIIQLLAPDVLTGPHQASAILNANSLEDTARVSVKEQFFITQRYGPVEDNNTIDLFFTPVDSFYINKSSIKYAATSNKIFRYSSNITKELMVLAGEQQYLPNATLWLAMDYPKIDLNHTQFFFQCRSEINKDVFYSQLKNTVWSSNGTSIRTRKGYNVLPETGPDWYSEQLLRQKDSVSQKFLRFVKEEYEDFFITIEDATRSPEKGDQLPKEIKEIFGTQLADFANEPLRWVKIEFPENITSAMLEDVNVFANAFPIVNRRLHDITFRLQEMMNIVPLVTGDNQFFDIDSITDETSKQLHVRNNEDQENKGLSILMRNGGAGRFDERDAAVVIENLVQLLRDESAAFARLGKDIISQEIKALQQSITKIEQMVGNTDHQTAFTPYLMVRNREQSGSKFLYINYWSTNGGSANGIRSGTRLQPYKTGAVKSSTVFLLTNTYGGKNRLNQSDSVVAYKYALLSKDRIMSKEDIRLFCKLMLGNRVSSVDISKGFMVTPDATKGFMKTVDVTITIFKKHYDEAAETGELTNWEKSLARQLSERSMAFLPFRVFIKSHLNSSIGA